MSIENIALGGVAALLAIVFFQPRLMRSPAWRATVTPLASIIGSGFLVAGPILAHAAGHFAVVAMLGLCALAYLFGAAIRHNIVHVEPVLAAGAPTSVFAIERMSDVSLCFAYFISVAYYLNLFAAFALRTGHVIDPFWIRVVATLVIAAVGLVGLGGGLRALERLEISAVAFKLSLIGGLVAAMAVSTFMAFASQHLIWPAQRHVHGLQELEILLGLVILVQGFETSRYLGHAYDAQTRVRTMRRAQWISTAIYGVFVLLLTRHFVGDLPKSGGETAIIDMLRPVSAFAAPLIIATALASQLSAAVADMNGAGGLIAETTSSHLSVNLGNLVTALAAIGMIWIANIFEIITYASKAFVVYYALQSLQALLSALRQRFYVRAALFALAIIVALCVLVLAIPAEAGINAR